MSIGYFLSDLAMILWTWPTLGGFEYVSMWMPWFGHTPPNPMGLYEPVYVMSRGLAQTLQIKCYRPLTPFFLIN